MRVSAWRNHVGVIGRANTCDVHAACSLETAFARELGLDPPFQLPSAVFEDRFPPARPPPKPRVQRFEMVLIRFISAYVHSNMHVTLNNEGCPTNNTEHDNQTNINPHTMYLLDVRCYWCLHLWFVCCVFLFCFLLALRYCSLEDLKQCIMVRLNFVP